MHAISPPACVCACLFTAVRSEFLCVCRTDRLLALGSPSGESPEMDGVQIPSGVRPNYRRFESCRIPCGYIASGLVAVPVGSKPARARAGPKQKRSRSAAAGRLVADFRRGNADRALPEAGYRAVGTGARGTPPAPHPLHSRLQPRGGHERLSVNNIARRIP